MPDNRWEKLEKGKREAIESEIEELLDIYNEDDLFFLRNMTDASGESWPLVYGQELDDVVDKANVTFLGEDEYYVEYLPSFGHVAWKKAS